MTDVPAIAPTAIRRSNLQRLSIPALRIGASLAAISCLLGDAFGMSYVAPYTSHGRRPQIAHDGDLEGRDPSW